MSQHTARQASWSIIRSAGLQVPKQAKAAAAAAGDALSKQALAPRQEASGGSHRAASPSVWVMASYYIEKRTGGFTMPVTTVK